MRHEVVEHTRPGLITREHRLEVPLVHGDPADPRTLELFAREAIDPDGRDRPLLVYLQGGPGNEATRPLGTPVGPAWLRRALAEYRVLLVDQRGTGLSAPVSDLAGMAPAEQAEHLTHFRADSIVADCELLRQALEVDRWSVLGQSFGGMCVLRYLSAAAHALREAIITAGTPPVGPRTDEVLATTWALAAERSERHYARYPEDRDRVRRLLRRARAGELRGLSGDRIGTDRIRWLGHGLGTSYGSEELHHVLERDGADPVFRDAVEHGFEVATTPLYLLLHEACWADGGVTGWSAQRTRPGAFDADETLLYGEHPLPSLLDEVSALAPLSEAAHLLAAHEWPRLYDPVALESGEVPTSVLITADDLYVPAVFARETTARMPRVRVWQTDEVQHDALRTEGERVLGRLIDMVKGRV